MNGIEFVGEARLQKLIKLLRDYQAKLTEEKSPNQAVTNRSEQITRELKQQMTEVNRQLIDLKATYYSPPKSWIPKIVKANGKWKICYFSSWTRRNNKIKSYY